MLEYTGEYASCKVLIDDIEETAVQQIYSFLNCPAFEGAQIRIMPDVHAGAGAVVGFTSTLTDKLIPNVVGVDIGCGVRSVCLGKVENLSRRLPALDEFVRKEIPFGFGIHSTKQYRGPHDHEYEAVAEATEQDSTRVLKSIRTLGGGNHFIEVGKDEAGEYWLTVHTGSRNFGLKIANYHQQKAVRTVGKGHGLEWLEGEAALLYLEHMKVAQQFAKENRYMIIDKIMYGFFEIESPYWDIDSVHNYIDFADNMIRKGAISAHDQEMLVIPWNMRDGLIIGRGKGSTDWNLSAPHGAGRVMARGQAKRSLRVEDFEKQMEGIWTSCVSKNTLDESPAVYKDPATVKEAIADTVEIIHVVKPVYSFKAE